MAATKKSPAWTWFRRLTICLALLVAVGYPIMYVALAGRGEIRFDLLLDALLAAVAAWFMWRIGRPIRNDPHACPSCAGDLSRTRTPAGERLWTCSACGYERARNLPRPAPGARSG